MVGRGGEQPLRDAYIVQRFVSRRGRSNGIRATRAGGGSGGHHVAPTSHQTKLAVSLPNRAFAKSIGRPSPPTPLPLRRERGAAFPLSCRSGRGGAAAAAGV